MRSCAGPAPPARGVPTLGEIRQPKVTEVIAIKALIDAAVKQGSVLPRELQEIYENVRDFMVYLDERGVGGCAALHIDTVELAEVRSLVVRDDLRGLGIGKQLVAAMVQEASQLGLRRVYALTRSPGFFLKSGFRTVDKSELPHKVFKDCLRCPLFPGCDEIAMVRDLGEAAAVAAYAQLPMSAMAPARSRSGPRAR